MVALLIGFVVVSFWFAADAFQRWARGTRTRNALPAVARAVERSQHAERTSAGSLP